MNNDNYVVMPEIMALSPAEGGRFRLRRGFSLIEIIVVVVIISIAAVMAVPMFSSASSVQVRSAANIIAADLEYAKSMAITTGQNYSVIFDATAESYRIVNQSGTDILHPVTKKPKYEMNFKSDSRLSKVNISSVEFDPASDRITFDYMGSPHSGNGGTGTDLNSGIIKINTADGASATIKVEPVTGYISITN